jgi:hypothetical protein
MWTSRIQTRKTYAPQLPFLTNGCSRRTSQKLAASASGFPAALTAAIALVFTVLIPSGAAQASLIGDSVQIIEFFPTFGTVFGSPTAAQTVTGAGVTFPNVGLSEVSLTVTGSTVTLNPLVDYTPIGAPFNGFDIHDLSSSPITGVLLASGALPAGDLTFDGSDVFVNLQNVALFTATPIVIDVVTQTTGVPEPATLAMFLVGLAGLAGLGAMYRPKRVTA